MGFSGISEEETELIPLLSNEEEDQMNQEKIPDILPILSLRNTVLFPGVVIPITVGRDKSINLIKDANKADKIVGVVSQKDDKQEDPAFEELNTVGTVAVVLKMFRMPDGNTTVIIQGKRRFKMQEMVQKFLVSIVLVVMLMEETLLDGVKTSKRMPLKNIEWIL